MVPKAAGDQLEGFGLQDLDFFAFMVFNVLTRGVFLVANGLGSKGIVDGEDG